MVRSSAQTQKPIDPLWGEPEKIYYASLRTGCAALGCGCLGVVFVTGLVTPLFTRPKVFGPTTETTLIGGVLLVTACLILLVQLRMSLVKVHLFPQGLLLFRGKDHVRIAWDEIVEVYVRDAVLTYMVIPVARFVDYTVKIDKGETYVLSKRLSGLHELGERLLEEVLKRRYAENVQAVSKGEKVFFGPITLAKQGIIVNGNPYLWEDIRSLTVAGGEWIIAPKKAWRAERIPIAAIPNFFILLALVKVFAPPELVLGPGERARRME